MKYYSIDEDVFKALLDMVREQALISKMDSDREAIMFYDFLIDQMLDADEFDTTAPKYKRPDDKIRLDKVERYLRMFHEQLSNMDIDKPKKDSKPKDKKDGFSSIDELLEGTGISRYTPERITNAKRDLRRDNIIQTMSLEEIHEYLLDDPTLTDEERFELYYYEREQLKKQKKKK